MASLPTLVCVHAHPDDESFFGSGAIAHYSSLGHRVVLITCTAGQLGFDGAGRSGDQPAHDALQTKVTRAAELQRSAEILGISRVVTLGYNDSGMKGWPENDSPNCVHERERRRGGSHDRRDSRRRETRPSSSPMTRAASTDTPTTSRRTK